MARKTTTKTVKSTTARKTAPKASSKATTKAVARAPKASPVAAAPAEPVPNETVKQTPAPTVLPTPEMVKTLTKRELVDRVVETSGIKKKDAKPVIEAMLRELGEALSRGETLNLQPLGKGIVKTRKVLENAEVVELRLRRSKQAMANAAEESAAKSDDGPRAPLAEAAE